MSSKQTDGYLIRYFINHVNNDSIVYVILLDASRGFDRVIMYNCLNY